MNKLLTALLAGLFAAALSTSALALDTSKATDMAKKAVFSVKDKAAGAVTPAAAPAPVAEPAAKPMSHKKHKHGKKHHAK